MALFGLFTTKAKRTLVDAEQSIIGYLAKTDFATVEAHQMGEYEDALTELSKQMAAAETVMHKEVAEAKAEHERFERNLQDIQKISSALADGSVTADKSAKFEAHLNKLVAETEEVKAKAAQEQQEADDATEHFNLLKDAVQDAAKRLTEAKSMLAKKKQELVKAEQEEKRNKEREEQQKVLLGIKEQTNTLGSVVGALDAEISKKKQAAAAAKASADALGASKKAAAGDEDINAFLGKADAAPAMSMADRIAALQAGK